MRILMKVFVPVDPGNKALADGTLAATIQATIDRIDPEVAYFGLEEGKRTGYFVFDMEDTTEMPAIVEPIFTALHASVYWTPVMNAADLKAGLTAWAGAATSPAPAARRA